MTVLTNKYGLPDPLVLAVQNDSYDSGACDISVTRLISPPQLQTLLERHGHDITEDVLDRLWAMYGQIAHTIAERAGTGNKESRARFVFEKRFFVQVPMTGWILSGQMDLYDKEEKCLQDYKFVGEYAIELALKEGKPEWEKQLNILRWLMFKETGELAEKLEIVAFARDLTVRTKTPAAVIKMPLWELSDTEQFIVERVKLHQLAKTKKDFELPPCTDEERWYNAKKGIYMRCERFCAAKSVCHQNKPVTEFQIQN
jgi:hypothetical protein